MARAWFLLALETIAGFKAARPEYDHGMSDLNDRLIQGKQQLAEKRAAQGVGTGREQASRDRLPPGQHLASGWPVLDLGIKPDIPTRLWQLRVTGACEPRTFTWADFMALPQTKFTTDFHCVTSWSIYDAQLEGVLWPDFIKTVSPKPEATHVMFSSYDGYTTNVSLEDLGMPNVAIIHAFGGAPLTKEHGGPVRTWVPHLYAWKSAKWVRGIEFMTRDKRGFWEVRGYHNRGDPWKEERYS
jgi:DMSO/TMAO reductase YedYZ molybdopterin-dependent catalytic subunit